MSVVIDASITITWLFDDENDAAAKALARSVADTGAVVPAIWRLEIANVLRMAERRGRCSQSFVDESLARLALLEVEVDSDTDAYAWNATLNLAREEDLTVYDAAYLELARRLGLPLATRDKELIAAATSQQVSLIGN